MRVHVAIVSEQLLPTVIPCLMHRPDRVVAVASQAMADKARRLETFLRGEGIDVAIRGHAPDADMAAIRAYARTLADELLAESSGVELTYNATGGNKLMTLGFVETFRERAARIIYTDTAHRRLEVIDDGTNRTPRMEPMRDVLDVPRYLAVQGFRYETDLTQNGAGLARVRAREQVARDLAAWAPRLGGLIGAINRLAHEALDKKTGALLHPVQRLTEAPHGLWHKALQRLAQERLVGWKAGETQITFLDAEGARFLAGGWLEAYAYAVTCAAAVSDVRLNVRGVWDGTTRARNEFDVLAVHANRLLVLECKTLRFQDGENDNELAYKVDSLGRDVRGLFGETWVLSAREPTAVLHERAQQAGFRLIGPKGLGSLPQWVRQWKEGRSAA